MKLVQEKSGLKLWVAETVTYRRTRVSDFAAHGLAPAPPGVGQVIVVLSKQLQNGADTLGVAPDGKTPSAVS